MFSSRSTPFFHLTQKNSEQENNINFVTEPEGEEMPKRCHVQLQKETPIGLIDDICGNDVEKGFAGLCRSVSHNSLSIDLKYAIKYSLVCRVNLIY